MSDLMALFGLVASAPEAVVSGFWLHPSLILIAGAVLLPLLPARLRPAWMVLVPVLTFARIVALSRGSFGAVSFLQFTLEFGRVDALSLVFAYIMGLMCILGTLYGLHVKRAVETTAAWVYVAGSI